MAAKRSKANDLQAIFAAPTKTAAQATTPKAAPPAATAAQPSRREASSRVGKRGKLVYLTQAAEKQLTILGAEQDKTQQTLMLEAVNLLFERYGRDQIA